MTGFCSIAVVILRLAVFVPLVDAKRDRNPRHAVLVLYLAHTGDAGIEQAAVGCPTGILLGLSTAEIQLAGGPEHTVGCFVAELDNVGHDTGGIEGAQRVVRVGLQRAFHRSKALSCPERWELFGARGRPRCRNNGNRARFSRQDRWF